MPPESDEFEEIVKRGVDPSNFCEKPSDLYKPEIHYAPGYFAREKGSGRIQMVHSSPEELLTAKELHPKHLTEQGIESYIDDKARNIVYNLATGGVATFGVYDRRNANTQGKISSQDELRESLISLVEDRDTEFPKIRPMELVSMQEFLFDQNFPDMYKYRSIVFTEDTKFGLIISVQDPFLIQTQEIKDMAIDEEYIKKYPNDMNFLVPVLMQAAKKAYKSFDSLKIADCIEFEGGGFRMKDFLNQKYSVSVSYKRTPQLGLAGRILGFPLCSQVKPNGKPQIYEMVFPPTVIADNRQIFLLSKAIMLDPEQKAYTSDLWYRIISREESKKLMGEYPSFGTLEFSVNCGVKMEDLEVEFTPIPGTEPNGFRNLSPIEDLTGSGSRMKYLGISKGGGGYTAGKVELNLQPIDVKIETTSFNHQSVSVRDIVCLVNPESSPNAPEYGALHRV